MIIKSDINDDSNVEKFDYYEGELEKDIHENDGYWDNIIAPQASLFALNLREVWHYRDLLILFVRRDVVSFYKQTIFGPVWYFIQPLFTMCIYLLIFGRLANLSTDGLPGPLFYLCGITAWGYFSECLTKTATVFKDNSAIFGKVYFPRLVMPLSLVISNLVRFGVQMILLVCFIAYYLITKTQIHFSWYILLFPLIVALMAAQGLGLGMIISAMTTKYRDLAMLLTFGVQLLMYLTTVVYPLSSLKGNMHTLVAYNPLTPLMEGIRKSILGAGSFDLLSLSYAFISTSIILILGVIIFNKVEKNFVDTI